MSIHIIYMKFKTSAYILKKSINRRNDWFEHKQGEYTLVLRSI